MHKTQIELLLIKSNFYCRRIEGGEKIKTITTAEWERQQSCMGIETNNRETAAASAARISWKKKHICLHSFCLVEYSISPAVEEIQYFDRYRIVIVIS